VWTNSVHSVSNLLQSANNSCHSLTDKMSDRKKITSVTLPPDLVDRADEVADEQDRSRSNLVTRAVRRYCDAHEQRKGESGGARPGSAVSIPA